MTEYIAMFENMPQRIILGHFETTMPTQSTIAYEILVADNF